MKISVITITARQNPRLDVVAQTLLASLARTGSDVELEWIIVDEMNRNLTDLIGREFAAIDSPFFSALVVKPNRSPYREGPERTPAHNTARNTGLALAFGGLTPAADYVIMLNDCNLVTIDWLAVARDCAMQGVGWKCKTHVLHDLAVPADGVIRMRDHNDRLRPVPYSTVAGPCWGAPRRAFEAIGGFDLAYDGQSKGADVDAVTRLARTGLTFISTERAFTVQLRRTKIASEITTSKEAHAGARNQQLLNELVRDKTRILPSNAPVAPAPRVATTMASPVAGVLVRRTGSAGASAAPTPRPTNNPAPVIRRAPAGANGANGAGDPLLAVDEDKLLDELGDL